MIELQHVSKQFITKTNEVEAVSDLSLTINTGEIFGIIGLSGAGKSTLVRCINYLEKPTSGEVLFNNVALSSLSDSELRKVRQKMAMVFQNFNLFSQRTILKNIMFPLEIKGVKTKEAKLRAQELLQLVELSSKADNYPNQLSGGQQQRVAIARALALDPEVLLCDEVTSALDPQTTNSILDLLKQINRELKVTIVIITHEMRIVRKICDRVAVLDQGKLQETGTVSSVFENPKSNIAKKLILPQNEVSAPLGQKYLRIVFDGQSAFEPVISNLVLECKARVNILAADTKCVGEKSYGQMVLQLPDDEKAILRIKAYLQAHKINCEEVKEDGDK